VCVCVCVSSLCLCVVGIDSSKFKRATPQDTAQRVSKDPAMNDSNNVSAFKEFKWYNTHNIPIEIQCGVCRLELPIDLSINSDDPSSCVFAGGDVFLTAHIICNQVPLHECPMYTHFAVPDGHRNALVWDCVLSFPVKLRDLSLNAVLAITAWTSTGRVIGGTTMRFFDNNGSLKRGKQKLIFFFGRQADTNVIADKNETPGELYDLYAAHDYGFMMEKHLEAYRASISEYDAQLRMGKSEFAGKVDWLDRLTLTRIQSTLEEANSRFGQLQSQYTVDYGSTFVPSKDASTFDIQVGRDRSTTGNINLGSSANNGAGTVYSLPPEEWDLQTYCCMVLEMAMYPNVVLHEEKLYPTVQPHVPPTQLSDIAANCVNEVDKDGTLEFTIANRSFNPLSLCVVADWDMDQDNLAELQYRSIAHDLIRGAADPSIKPNLQEKSKLDRIIGAPGTHLTNDEMDLLYKFRFTLTENKKALIKFLLSVNWNVESEVGEVPSLLIQWKEKAPIDIADALKLLGRERAFEHSFVRSYAVEVLESASDEDLLTYLLQLVQALRYEQTANDSSTAAGAVKPPPAPEVVARTGFAGRFLSKATPPPAPTSTAIATSSTDHYTPPVPKSHTARASKTPTGPNSFYWYLKVETHDKACGMMFVAVLDAFLLQLSTLSGTDGALLAKQIDVRVFIVQSTACGFCNLC
jgi:hypothetical protein